MRIKKKYTTGTAATYISRKKALRKLQLSLKDFGRLCILKGIYPREPNHLKKANKGGSTEPKIYYHVRDIKFLAQEPLINKFREYKIFLKKVNHAKAKKEELKVKSLFRRKPKFTYDHIIKERYPTFISALRDLDDALCLCFAFAALTQSKVANSKLINRCRRLTIEFMHYIIESKSLKKVFISIKGIYYQAEVMGERITWIVGHERSVGRANELDLTTVAYFVEFYSVLLSFVNFRLYKSIGLFYPPQLQLKQNKSENKVNSTPSFTHLDDRVFSLAFPLAKIEKTEEELDICQIDTFEKEEDENDEEEKEDVKEIKEEDLCELLRQNEALKTLFSKMRFFINREVPKEPLAFVIRAGGGDVCWEDCYPVGSITNVSSELITHQIVDRQMKEMIINRIYIQPQWIFDCFNSRRLLPTILYAPSTTLPPHLSPFIGDNERLNNSLLISNEQQKNKDETKVEENVEGKSEEKGNQKEKKGEGLLKKKNKKNKQQQQDENNKGMSVQKSRIYKESEQKKINEEGHNLKLREMMIPKKHKRIYEKLKRGTKRRARAEIVLEEKRAKLAKT
uniref:Pescadillo homolog n=3 Tax=Meloidogyne TaxID=189290 RepID=A0A914LYP5_MELIC